MHELKPEHSAVDLMELVELFYQDPHQLGQFEGLGLKAESIPQPQRDLLNHEAHMTVTVEAFHGGPVDVRVDRTRFGVAPGDDLQGSAAEAAAWYAREITLHRQSDGAPVQYGIVRLNIPALATKVWNEIRSQQTPLGRVLIENQVLREVELCGLWKIVAGERLADLLGCEVGQVVYGRTARILCDRQPAIDLLEVVSP